MTSLGLDLPSDDLNFNDVQHQTETLIFNSRLLNDFTTLINDIDFIRQHTDRFRNPDGSPPDDQALQAARKKCLESVDALQKSISECSKDASVCEHFLGAPEDLTNTLPALRHPRPGQRKVPRLTTFKAGEVAPSFPFSFQKNETMVGALAQEGLFFVIDNSEDLEFHPLGSSPSPDAGTITIQSPAEEASVPAGTVIHVTVSPLQKNPGPLT